MPKRKHPQIKFTKTALLSLKAPPPSVKSGVGYYDTEVKRLCIRVFPSGKKTFTLITRYAGRPNKYKLGTFPETSIENARKAALKIIHEIQSGINPRDAKTAKKLEKTFDEYFKIYQKDYPKKTANDDSNYYKRYLTGWTHKRLSDIKTSDIRAMHNRVGQKNGIYAANHALIMVKTMYNRAINDGYYKSINPANGIKRFKTESREVFLDDDKIRYFIESAHIDEQQSIAEYKSYKQHAGYFYLLLLYIGQRKQNTLEMRWDQIKWQSGIWSIPKTKNGKPQHARLNKQALGILQKIKKDSPNSEWVFPKQTASRKQPAKEEATREHMWEPRDAWARILRRTRLLELVDALAPHYKMKKAEIKILKATSSGELDAIITDLEDMANAVSIDTSHIGIKNFRIHDLRRTYGSLLIRSGANETMVGKALGHLNQASTAVYARILDKPLHAVVDTAFDNI